MTDRELLEKAAKAAGMIPSDCMGNANYMDTFLAGWKPLERDGDAMRLAVQRRLSISFSEDGWEVRVEAPNGAHWTELCELDPGAATRRAIVCAVAAMEDAGGTE